MLAAGLALGITFGTAVVLRARHTPLPPGKATGRELFVMSCAHCHGDDAHGDEGPDLHNLRIGDTHIALLIKSGIKGDMPSFEKKHNDADIVAITAYLRTLK